jgi:hypothetical protein
MLYSLKEPSALGEPDFQEPIPQRWKMALVMAKGWSYTLIGVTVFKYTVGPVRTGTPSKFMVVGPPTGLLQIRTLSELSGRVTGRLA